MVDIHSTAKSENVRAHADRYIQTSYNEIVSLISADNMTTTKCNRLSRKIRTGDQQPPSGRARSWDGVGRGFTMGQVQEMITAAVCGKVAAAAVAGATLATPARGRR